MIIDQHSDDRWINGSSLNLLFYDAQSRYIYNGGFTSFRSKIHRSKISLYHVNFEIPTSFPQYRKKSIWDIKIDKRKILHGNKYLDQQPDQLEFLRLVRQAERSESQVISPFVRYYLNKLDPRFENNSRLGSNLVFRNTLQNVKHLMFCKL